MSPDVVIVCTDAGGHLAKPGCQEQFCNNAPRPGGRHGLPARPDAVATRPASADDAAAVAVAPYAHDAVVMSLDAGKQLALSPAARDHVATTERPRKPIVAARALLRTPS